MPQLHPSSLDLRKEGFEERCYVHLRGHKKTLWTPDKTTMNFRSCRCCTDKEEGGEEEDSGDQQETAFMQI